MGVLPLEKYLAIFRLDGAPQVVKEGISKEEAATIKEKLEATGASVEIR